MTPLGFFQGPIKSGTPGPHVRLPLLIPIRIKGFEHGNGMGVVWEFNGGPTIAATWIFSLDEGKAWNRSARIRWTGSERINGIFHLLINGVFLGVITH